MATCTNCGTVNSIDAAYCVTCGKPIPRETRLKSVAIAVAVLAVIASIVICALVMHTTPSETAHVSLKIVAPGYSEGDSPIPLLVEGETATGQAVNEVVYASGDGDDGFDVHPGEYAISLEASPLCESGRLYEPADESVSLLVSEESCRSGVSALCPDIQLRVVPDEEMTADLIDQAYDAAIDAGFDVEKANAYRAAAQERCGLSPSEGSSEGLENMHVVTEEGYEFDLPEYWRGKVSLDHFENRFGLSAIGVRAKDVSDPDTYLVVIGKYPADIQQTGGDYVSPAQYAVSEDKSMVVSIGGRNWPVVACEYTTSGGVDFDGRTYSIAEMEALVDLSSGGALTYQKAVDTADANDLTMFEIDYYRQIRDSVVFDGEADVAEPSGDEFQNPATLDVSGEQDNEYATLYGTLQRKNMTPEDTHSALGGPMFFLVFDKPITITYNGPFGTETREYSAIQSFGSLTSTAQDEYKANHPELVDSPYDEYVGKRVAVSGRILDAGSVYYLNGAAFFEPELEPLD